MKKIMCFLILFLFFSCEPKEKESSGEAAGLLLLLAQATADNSPKCDFNSNDGLVLKYPLFTASTTSTAVNNLTFTTYIAIKASNVTVGKKVTISGTNFQGTANFLVYSKEDCPIQNSDLASASAFTQTNNSVGSTLSRTIEFNTAGSYILLIGGFVATGVNIILQ